jgi:hypothetical protein
MQDKRRCHRFKVELPAWFKADPLDDTYSMSTTIDISALGISLVVKSPLEIGQEFLIQVKMPSEEILLVKTQVVWVKEDFRTAIREYHVGLKIVEPINHDEAKFVKYCAMLMLEYYKHPQDTFIDQNTDES